MPDPSTQPGEALAAPLRRHLLQQFPADRAYPRSAIRAEGMPPPVAAFLGRTLDRWVEIERERFRADWLRTGWIDAEDAVVQRTEHDFFDAVVRSARVPADAWEDTLGGAVDLVVRFLTVPARALTDAIFEGSADPLPADVIRARLPLFSAYPYLADIATAYLDRKKPEDMDPADLFALLDRIDRRFVNEFEREDWLPLLDPLFALSRHVPSLDGVPTLLLQRFFDAKGEDDIVDLLAGHEADMLDEASLRDMLASAFPDEPTPEEPPDEEPDEEGEPDLSEPAEAETHVDEQETENESEAAEPKAIESEVPEAEQNTAEPQLEAVESEAVEPEPSEPAVEVAPAERTAVEPGTVKFLDLGESDDEPSSTDEPSHAEAPDVADAGRPLWERFAEDTADGDSVNARFGTSESDADNEEIHADDADVAPLWKRFFTRGDAKLGDAKLGDTTPEPSPPIAATRGDEEDDSASLNGSYTSREAPQTSTPPAQPADSLDALEQRVLGSMPTAQRKRFIKHLFGGDAGKYVTVLHGLDGADTWTEASQVIARDVFRPSRINIYGEHAIAFTDAVEARFRT